MNKKPPKPGFQKPPKPSVRKAVADIPNPASKLINVKTILFFAVLVISFIVFITNFYDIKELSNPFIKRQAGWVMSVQVLFYAMIYGLFGYFGFLFINEKKESRVTTIMMWAGLILIIAIHWLAFNAGFEDVDDNASYMIAAKSLVERGAPYYLYAPNSPVDTEGALGLPVMLIPCYLIWGMNFKPMEILILLTMIGSVIMCFLLFKKMAGKTFALIITILFGTHPYIVAFSSIIMTEIPYLFWSMLAILLILKYEEKEKFNIWWMLAALLAVFMTYLTRAVGSGLFIAVVLYFLLKSNILPYIKKKSFQFIKDPKFLKFIFISAALFILLLTYQLWAHSLGGVSQAETLAKMNLAAQFSKNFDAIWQVLSQNIFTGSIIRWEVKQIEPMNFLWILVFLITIAGLVISLFKRQLVALYVIFVALVLMLGNTAVQPIVVSRYLIVFTPFLIYFFYLGIQWPVSKLIKKGNWGATLGTTVLAMILASSFVGNGYTIQKSHTGQLYPVSYSSFLDCAAWAKDNLPKDAVVASRKERIFYIFSGLQGFKHAKSNELASVKTESDFIAFKKKKLAEFAKNNTKYVIIDTFNSSTINFIFPIIQENPDKFKLIKTIGDEKTGPCYVFEVIKWW
jgi:hypothetical protein